VQEDDMEVQEEAIKVLLG